jgi:hypothetical protein
MTSPSAMLASTSVKLGQHPVTFNAVGSCFEYENRAGRHTRLCVATCEGTTYTTATDQLSACKTQPANCQGGTFESTVASNTAARVCQACVDGTFSVGVNALACSTWRSCSPVQMRIPGTARTDASCVGMCWFAVPVVDLLSYLVLQVLPRLVFKWRTCPTSSRLTASSWTTLRRQLVFLEGVFCPAPSA